MPSNQWKNNGQLARWNAERFLTFLGEFLSLNFFSKSQKFQIVLTFPSSVKPFKDLNFLNLSLIEYPGGNYTICCVESAREKLEFSVFCSSHQFQCLQKPSMVKSHFDWISDYLGLQITDQLICRIFPPLFFVITLIVAGCVSDRLNGDHHTTSFVRWLWQWFRQDFGKRVFGRRNFFEKIDSLWEQFSWSVFPFSSCFVFQCGFQPYCRNTSFATKLIALRFWRSVIRVFWSNRY